MSKVEAIVRGQEVLVWSAEDAVWLREEWRIIGSFTGALGSQPRQNAQLGLPLSLSPDETTLLVDHGVVQLCSYSPHLPTQEDGQRFNIFREEDFQNQVDYYLERRQKARRDRSGEGDGGVRRDTSTEGGGETLCKRRRLDDTEEGGVVSPAVQRSEVISSFSPLVCIHTTAPPSTGSHPLGRDEWRYPRTLSEVVRYRVFSDLWSRGKYVTSGVKYGGDFLVYSGDPALVHSDYIAVVLPWQQPITNLVALGHLGSKVRKNTLFCSVSPEDVVTYFSLEWSRI